MFGCVYICTDISFHCLGVPNKRNETLWCPCCPIVSAHRSLRSAIAAAMCFSKDVFFLSVFNSLTFLFFLFFNIDSGVFFHCCQGRDTRGIGPLASRTFLFYVPNFKM